MVADLWNFYQKLLSDSTHNNYMKCTYTTSKIIVSSLFFYTCKNILHDVHVGLLLYQVYVHICNTIIMNTIGAKHSAL
jgi:hypothetical protein